MINLIAEVRRKNIVDIVKKDKNVSCLDLSRNFKVTPETIRRDLGFLSEKGLLIRTHGGASAIPDEVPPINTRKLENLEAKKAIAAYAATLIADNDVVFLDAGTTTGLICDFLPAEKSIYLITTSFNCIADLINKENITLIGAGGLLRRETMAFVGTFAEQTIRSSAINKAFISALAVSTKFGIMDSNQDEANLNRIAIRNAKEVFLLVDSSKFNKIAYINVERLENITGIITDSNLDEKIRQELEDMHIMVVLADRITSSIT